jgi:DNA-binding IscR family transcriptional regulator
MPGSKYVGVSLTPEGRQALRVLTGLASGAAERPVSTSETLTAALVVVRQHLDELAAALPREPG